MSKVHNCFECAHVHRSLAASECRFNPPSVFLLPRQNMAGQVEAVPAVCFPQVTQDMRCSKFESKAIGLVS